MPVERPTWRTPRKNPEKGTDADTITNPYTGVITEKMH